MKKIALIIPMLQPYRVKLYERLIDSTKDKYEWCIFHGVKDFDDARPAFEGVVKFKTNSYITKAKRFGPLSIMLQNYLYRDLKKYDPDIIIVNANAGEVDSRRVAYWAEKNNRKLILWVCSWDSNRAKGLFRFIKRKLTKIYYKRGDRFLAYSSHAASFIERFGIPSNKITVAYNGLDIDELENKRDYVAIESKKIKAELNPENRTVFLYVGGLIPMKLPLLLVDSFMKLNKENENVELWIIGDGPLMNELEDKVSNSSNIKCFGRIVEDVDKYFAAADWFVLPGAGGLALNQSMYWKTPCICSVADGTEADLVFDNINGYRFHEKDSDSLYLVMKKAVNTSSVKKETMGSISKYLIENRSNTDTMFHAFIDSIEN